MTRALVLRFRALLEGEDGDEILSAIQEVEAEEPDDALDHDW